MARGARKALEEADAEQEVERILARGGVGDDGLGLLRCDLLLAWSAAPGCGEQAAADLLGGGERGLVQAALELVRGALAHRGISSEHTKSRPQARRLYPRT